MMLLFVLLIGAAWLSSGWLPGMAALLCAAVFFIHGSGVQLSLQQGMLLAGFLLMVPAAAYLAGFLLDRFAWDTVRGGVFAAAAFGFAFMLSLQSGLLTSFVEACLIETDGALRPLLVFTTLVNGVLLVSAVTAVCIMMLQLIIELPFRWLQASLRSAVVLPFAALRPLIVMAGLTLLIHYISGLFIAELRPDLIVQAAERK